MDTLEFIAALVDAIAWPVAIATLVSILKNPIESLLPLLSNLKYKDLEVDFAQELEEAEATAQVLFKETEKGSGDEEEPKEIEESASSEANKSQRNSTQTLEEAEKLKNDFPEPAVAVAWSAVEDELRNTVMRLAISPDHPLDNSFYKNTRLLEDKGKISESTVSLIERMRKLRNLAVHGGTKPGLGPGPVTKNEANEFLNLARNLVKRLQDIERS